MIPYEKLCKALDRHKRKMRGEAVEEPLSMEENIQEVEEFAVDDEAILDDPLLATDPGIIPDSYEEDYSETGPLGLEASETNEQPIPEDDLHAEEYGQQQPFPYSDEGIPPEPVPGPPGEPSPEYLDPPGMEFEGGANPDGREYPPSPPEQWPDPEPLPPGPPPAPGGEAKKTMFGMPAGPEPLPHGPSTQEIDIDSVDIMDDDFDPELN